MVECLGVPGLPTVSPATARALKPVAAGSTPPPPSAQYVLEESCETFTPPQNVIPVYPPRRDVCSRSRRPNVYYVLTHQAETTFS